MKRLIEFFVRYGIWADVLMYVTIGFGLFALFGMNRSFFPERQPRDITVQVTYPGASPEEMEEGVVLKVEEELEGIEGLEEFTSVASENVATISIKGRYGYDIEEVLTDVKNAVDQINSFPENAEKPVVFQRKPVENVISVMVTSPNRNLFELKDEAERIKDELLAREEISQVEIQGLPELEISIELNEEDLQRYGLTLESVGNAVRLNNLDLSAGELKGEREEILLRLREKTVNEDSVANIVLRSRNDGSLLRLKDVATVTYQYADVPDRIFYNGERAVRIQVQKLPIEDILAITDYVNQYVEDYNDGDKAYTLSINRDRSVSLRQRISLLVENGAIGLVLVLVVLGLFLSPRLSFWVAVGIPISFFGMFIIGNLAGITINMLSLFGMILVVGILVDDGIVIAENIYANYEKGYAPRKAAVRGALEVLPSVFTSVTTTMLAFVPFFFIESTLGEFISEMGAVVIACLGFSLIEASLILPAHLVHYGAIRKRSKNKVRKGIDDTVDYLRYRLYAPALRKALTYRYISLGATLLIAFVLSGVFSAGYIQSTFFPFIDFDNVDLNLALQPGTPDHKTEEVLEGIARKINETDEYFQQQREDGRSVVKNIAINVGQGAGASGGHTGNIRIELLDGETRQMPSFKFTNELMDRVGKIPDAEQFTAGTRRIFGKPISLSLTSRDIDELEAGKEFLKQRLQAIPELTDIVDNRLPGKRELQFELKPAAYFLGLTRSQIMSQVRRGFFGFEVQRLQDGIDEVKVWVRYKASDRSNIGDLDQMRIQTGTGEMYPLTELVSWKIARGVVAINHYNGRREIRVDADLRNQDTPVPPINEEIQATILPEMKERFPGLQVTFEGQAKENRKFSSSALKYGIMAFLGIMVIITLSFRSFPQMVLVILMIPLGILFAILGHGIEGKPVSLLSIYGMIGLTGIIVNDAVVLMDRFNRNIREGLPFFEALNKAGKQRFRAILLTSLTTVVGLYPLILETSTQAQFLVPMAISVAYGVLFVTVIILFIFPVSIAVLNDIRVGLVWLWTGKRPAQTAVEPAWREVKHDNPAQTANQTPETDA